MCRPVPCRGLHAVFAIFGLAGVLNAQRELIIAFFAYNVASVVISFHYFVDLCTDAVSAPP